MRCLPLKLRRNLTFRLILTFVFALILFIVAINAYTFVLNPDYFVKFVMDKQFELLRKNTYVNKEGIPAIEDNFSKREWVYDELKRDLFYQIVHQSGKVIFSSQPSGGVFTPNTFSVTSSQSLQSEDANMRNFLRKSRLFKFTLNGEKAYAISRPLPREMGEYNLQIATSERILEVFQLTNVLPLSQIALVISFVSLLIIIVMVVFTVRYMLKPIRQISHTASKISPQNLQSRLPIDAIPTELTPLIHAFNDTLCRLEKGFNIQQDFLATTAHELKTPLCLIRGEIELASELNSRDTLLQDIDLISRQIHQILHLAEAREPQNYQLKSLDLLQTTQKAIAYLSRLSQAKNVRIVVKFSPDIRHIHADESMVFILIKNLLENAIKHAPEGTAIDVYLDNNELRIRDYGMGISESNIPFLFEKFWRNSTSKGATGLGLSICREIALAHRWQLYARNVYKGAEFTLALTPNR
ncbi:Sensor protein QseC [Thalassocella blandensis]|nr:Sensor protein QseC [Thalassocella blandensis]